MSNNHKKRKTQNKKTHYKKNTKNTNKRGKSVPELTFFQKMKRSKPVASLLVFFEKMNLESIKNKFKKSEDKKNNSAKKSSMKNKIKFSMSEVLDSSTKYFKKNKKEIIFFSGMVLIIATIFVAINLPSTKEVAQEKNEVVSIDLSDSNESMLMNVDDQISQVVKKDSNVDMTAEVVTTDVVSNDVVVNLDVESAEATDVVDDSLYTLNEDASKNIIVTQTIIPELEELMSVAESMMVGISSFAIIVDEKPIAFFKTEDEANNFLVALKNEFKDPEAVEETLLFAEAIRVEKYKNDILDFKGYQSFEDIMEFVKKGTNEQKIHTVLPGENFWLIAERYDMNPYDIMDANPGINETKLQIGHELSLIVPEPIINVLTISIVERIDEIPYGQGESVNTDKYYVGERVTKVSGVPGIAKNVLKVYTENGKFYGEKIISSEVTKEPIDMIAYVGTKPAPPAIGTGTFSKPTSRGYVTSNFGPRSLGYHNGIDIGIDRGTELFAADGGVVIFAGYKGNYGKLVIIDHGANLTSRYAHLNEWLVSPGENVFKGQLIARSGNTGRSTGPHVHFEIQKNGTPVNPRKYVDF